MDSQNYMKNESIDTVEEGFKKLTLDERAIQRESNKLEDDDDVTRTSHKTQLASEFSFRTTTMTYEALTGKEVSEINSFKLDRNCARVCYYRDKLWCPCYIELFTGIHVYDMNGSLERTIKFRQVKGPQSIHPLYGGSFVIAATNGLYIAILDDTEADAMQIMKGKFWDLHIHKSIIVAIEKADSGNDTVHRIDIGKYLCSTELLKQHIETLKEKFKESSNELPSDAAELKYSGKYAEQAYSNNEIDVNDTEFKYTKFALNNSSSENIIVTEDHIFISFYEDFKQSHIIEYSHTGENLRRFGEFGKEWPGQLDVTTLCCINEQNTLLVVGDLNNKRIQLLDLLKGTWSILKCWTNEWQPIDAIFKSEVHMIVLCFNTSDKQHYIKQYSII